MGRIFRLAAWAPSRRRRGLPGCAGVPARTSRQPQIPQSGCAGVPPASSSALRHTHAGGDAAAPGARNPAEGGARDRGHPARTFPRGAVPARKRARHPPLPTARTFPQAAMSAGKRERTRCPLVPAEPIAAEFRCRLRVSVPKCPISESSMHGPHFSLGGLGAVAPKARTSWVRGRPRPHVRGRRGAGGEARADKMPAGSHRTDNRRIPVQTLSEARPEGRVWLQHHLLPQRMGHVSVRPAPKGGCGAAALERLRLDGRVSVRPAPKGGCGGMCVTLDWPVRRLSEARPEGRVRPVGARPTYPAGPCLSEARPEGRVWRRNST